MFSNYKHIIWDWNGTLLDDVGLCVDIINGVLSRRNLDSLTLNYYRDIFTFPIKNYYKKAGFDFDRYTFEEVGQEWINEYERRKNECELHKGAMEILTLLRRKKIEQSILSAYSHKTLIEIVTNLKLNEFFKYIIGLDNIYASSKIELGKELMKNINNKGKVLLIGDTKHDYEVSKEIGTDCALIADGHQSKEKLIACNVPVFDSLSELSSKFNSGL
jgi:phosphoglycolate phosphatase